MEPVRIADLWPLLKARLDTPHMAAILGGRRADGGPRVYHVLDNFSAAEGPESRPWGRVVLVPSDVPWERATDAPARRVNFLVRAEFNDFRAKGYNVQVALEAAQQEAHSLLRLWVPELSQSTAAMPLYLYREPQASPLWDDGRGLYFTTSEWRMEAAAGLIPVATVIVTPAALDLRDA